MMRVRLGQFGRVVYLGARPRGNAIYSLSNLSFGPLKAHVGRFGFWFRVFGFGIRVVDRIQLRPLFSVRHGFVRELRIGAYGVGLLTPRSGR